MNSSTTPLRQPLALAASAILIAALILFTRQMISIPEGSGSKLAFQIGGYGVLLAATLGAAWWTKSDVDLMPPHAFRVGKALLVIGLLTVTVRFAIKQPPASWADNHVGEWLSITEAYVVGRLLVPVFEEVLFRGFFWASLVKGARPNGWIPSLPTLVTSAVFGGLHWPGFYGLSAEGAWPIVVSAFVGGILFGILRQRTGSIQAGVGLHIIGNTVGF